MDKEKKQDIIIRVCCVIAALGLWMYVRINENPVITSTMRYVPVQVLNEESLANKSLILIPNQEFYLSVTVKGTTSAVSEIDKNKDFKLQVDLDGYALIPGENRVQVSVKQSPAGVSIVNPEGLVLKIDIDNLVQKNFEVTAKVTGKVPEGYYNEENIVSQKTVMVEGAERYVNKVSAVVAEVDIDNIEEDIDQNYRLKAIDNNGRVVEGVSIYPEFSRVVSKITKGKFVDVNVVTSGNTPASIKLDGISVSPHTLEIVGDRDVIEGVSKINTKPIDLSGISDNTTVTAQLELPEGVKASGGVESVQVAITVKKTVEKTVSIPIEYINLGEGLTETHVVSEIQITVRGYEDVVAAAKLEDIKAVADLKDLVSGNNKVSIAVTNVPTGIEVISKTPDSVEVDIKSVNEETEADDNKN